MSAGKLASQAGHAFLDAYDQCRKDYPDRAEEYNTSGTKVVLRAKSSEHLIRAEQEAKALGIPCSLIIDSGHIMPPYFDGNPIITALGIGPATRSEIKRITKRFQLVN